MCKTTVQKTHKAVEREKKTENESDVGRKIGKWHYPLSLIIMHPESYTLHAHNVHPLAYKRVANDNKKIERTGRRDKRSRILQTNLHRKKKRKKKMNLAKKTKIGTATNKQFS